LAGDSTITSDLLIAFLNPMTTSDNVKNVFRWD